MSGVLAIVGARRGQLGSTGAVVGGDFTATTVAFNSNGTMSYGTTSGGESANWHVPTTGGIGSSFWYRITQTGGSVFFSVSTGVWLSLASGSGTISATGGAGGASGTVEFATDSGGLSIVGNGDIAVSNAS